MSFFDHFSGSSLDARWTGVTAVNGTNTVSGSVYRQQRPADGDAAYAYYATPLDKTQDQLWLICSNVVTGAWRRNWMLRDTATPGTPIAFSDTTSIMQVQVANNAGAAHVIADHWNSAGSRRTWLESTPAWNSSVTYNNGNKLGLDNYCVSGFEFDATNSRWRILIYGLYTGSFTADQGLKLFQCTDWVTWANTRSNTNLYLFLGVSFSEASSSDDFRYEWVRMENGARRHAWGNGRASGSGVYSIRHFYDFSGGSFVPQDRSTDAVAKGTAGAWDDDHVKDPFVVKDGATYYMFYDGNDGARYQIGLATATDPAGTWTKDGGNPIISFSIGTDRDQVFFPYVVKDDADADANKRWKMLYVGVSGTPFHYHLYYAYAAAATGPWTTSGSPTAVLSEGGAGAFDENGINNPVFCWYNGQWEVWYAGQSNDPTSGETTYQTGRATGPTLDNLTKDGSGARITWQSNGIEVATGAVNGRTVSMSDTTGFSVDGTVVMNDGNTGDNWSISKIRAITTNTSLELYHAVTHSSAPGVAQVDAWRGLYLRDIRKSGNTWEFWGVAFRGMNWSTSYATSLESTTLWTHTGAGPADATPVMDITQQPHLPLTEFGFDVSSENITLATLPIFAGESYPAGFIHPVQSTLLRM